jgi:hypothetical protein
MGLVPVIPAPVGPGLTGELMTTETEGWTAFGQLHRYCIPRDLRARRDVLWRIMALVRARGSRFPGPARPSPARLSNSLWGPHRAASGAPADRAAARACGRNFRAALGLPPEIAPVPAPGAIRLPPPWVSIIPTYGQVDYALRCLASLRPLP